jgi:hypothetical protein
MVTRQGVPYRHVEAMSSFATDSMVDTLYDEGSTPTGCERKIGHGGDRGRCDCRVAREVPARALMWRLIVIVCVC